MPTYPHVTLTASEVEVCLPVIQLDSSGWVQAETPVFDPNHCWPPALPRPLAREVFHIQFLVSNWWGPEGCSLIWLGVKPRLAGLGQWLRLCHLGPLDQPEAGPGLRVWSGGSSCLAPQGRSFMTVLPQSHSSDKSQESFHCQLAWESYSNCQCPDGATKSDWTLFCLYSHLFNLI